MRKMSQNQADRCEAAKHPRCRCRCGGRLHGISHSYYRQMEEAAITNGEELSQDKINSMVDQARTMAEQVKTTNITLTLKG